MPWFPYNQPATHIAYTQTIKDLAEAPTAPLALLCSGGVGWRRSTQRCDPTLILRFEVNHMQFVGNLWVVYPLAVPILEVENHLFLR